MPLTGIGPFPGEERRLLVDRHTGKAMTITLWEDEAAMQQTAGDADEVRERARKAFGGTIESVETYEVAEATVGAR